QRRRRKHAAHKRVHVVCDDQSAFFHATPTAAITRDGTSDGRSELRPYFTSPQSAPSHLPAMSMVISISRPRSVDLDLTVPLYEPEPVDSMCIVAVDAGEVHTMLASIDVRVLFVIVCVQFWFGRCCMKEFFSYFSFVMQ